MYIYIYIYIYMYMCVCVCIYIYIYILFFTCTYSLLRIVSFAMRRLRKFVTSSDFQFPGHIIQFIR